MSAYESGGPPRSDVHIDPVLDAAPPSFDTLLAEQHTEPSIPLTPADEKAYLAVAEDLELLARRIAVPTLAHADIVTGDHSMSAADLTIADLAILHDDGFVPAGEHTQRTQDSLSRPIEIPYGFEDF